MVDALGENHDEAMWFNKEIGKVFAVEYHCKKMGMSAWWSGSRPTVRPISRPTLNEAQLKMYEASGYAECGTS